MPTLPRRTVLAHRTGVAGALGVTALATTVLGLPPPATAAPAPRGALATPAPRPPTPTTPHAHDPGPGPPRPTPAKRAVPPVRAPARGLAGVRALGVAAAKKGAPYQYGAAGPHRFDCSGLTLYAFRKVGKRLPRTAAGQYNRVKRLAPADRTAGDLVFFHRGRHVYHVGIYAGRNRIWHSPRPGRKVGLERIWTREVWYGRVR